MKGPLVIAAAVSLLLIGSFLAYQQSSTPAIQSNLQSVTAPPAKIIAGEVHYSRIPVEYW
jgi:hypothetical protein